ncbi:MAG: hypothetical protein IT353_14050 [Gemmatimonadaceae bacterium]|nr:hypothetical protein [Gemmatimonadaceae bacterium]
MSNDNTHIRSERFAALDDQPLTLDELAHVARCAACRDERQAYLSLRALAAAAAEPMNERDVLQPRLTEWEALSSALRADGLLRTPTATDSPMRPEVASVVRHSPSAGSRTWLRVAAAAVLTIGGALMGRLSAGGSLLPGMQEPSVMASTGFDSGAFASVQDASETLYRAQRAYENASLWLAGNDTTAHSGDVYRARLAVLDQMMAASRAALRDAPNDPVLTSYFQAAYDAREATLQALSSTLPVDKTMERY